MVESGHDRKEKDGSGLSQGPCQVLHHRCNYQLHLWKWEKLRNCWAKFQKTLTRYICGRNVTEQKYASHVMAKDLAPSRSPTVGWLAMHFSPGRKWEFFPTCESSSRSHPVIWFRSPFSKSVPGNWPPKVVINQCNVENWIPTNNPHHRGYFTWRRCSLADCRRLTDPPKSSCCPFYPPWSLF